MSILCLYTSWLEFLFYLCSFRSLFHNPSHIHKNYHFVKHTGVIGESIPVYRHLLVPQTQHSYLQNLGQEQQGLLLGKFFLFQSIKREKPLSSTLLLVAHLCFSAFHAIFLLTFRIFFKKLLFGILACYLWECKVEQMLWKAEGGLFQKLSTKLHNPAIPFPFIYSEELESRHSSRCYTPMFISALRTIAERWKSPKWVNKRWHIYI